MNLKLRSSAFVLPVLAAALTVSTSGCFRQSQVNQLLETRECRGCNLQGANLERKDLQGVDLEGANLQGANLRAARLGNANLKRANLENADLELADMGCMGFQFNVRGSVNEDTVSMNIEEAKPMPSPNSTFGLQMNSDKQGATFRLNLGGCANLQGANLSGATMPDGTVHQ